MKKIIVISLILVIPVFLLIQGKEKPESKEIAPKTVARATVAVSTVERGSVFRGYTAVGIIAPEDKARIMPKVAGRISSLAVEEGDLVEKGDLLMSIDTFDYIRAVENVTAIKNQAKANLAKTKRDYLRMERLYRDKTISEQTYRDTKTVYELAQYAHDQAQVAHKTAERNLRECRVVAPIHGIITGKHVNEGELTGPQTVALVIMRMDKVKVEIDLPENAYGFMTSGSTCLIRIDAMPHETCEGKIIRIHPTIDPISRTVKVTVGLDNPGLRLRSGMTARANVIQTARKDVIFVPKSAVVQGEAGLFVFRVASDKVEKTPIAVGIEGDDVFEIRNGLSLGDQVVTKGLTGLRDGMPVITSAATPGVGTSENPPA